MKRAAIAASVLGYTLAIPVSGFAQTTTVNTSNNANKSNAWSTQTLTVNPSSAAMSVDSLGGLNDFGGQERSIFTATVLPGNTLSHGTSMTSLFDLVNESNTPLFNLEAGGQLCLRTTDDCALNDDSVGLGITRGFSKAGSRGVDMELSPHAGMSFDDESSSALVGALVKIGDNLKSPSQIDPNTWYFFAGADAQAVTYTPNGSLFNSNINDTGRFALRDSVIVGDAQAGLAYRLGKADLSLTYLRREARAENYVFEEDAAALSFTWRH